MAERSVACARCDDTHMVDDPAFPGTTEWILCPDCSEGKHDPNRVLREAFLAGAAAQEDVEHCARLGVYHRIESYFEDFLAELKKTD